MIYRYQTEEIIYGNDLPVDLKSGHSQLGDGGIGILLWNRRYDLRKIYGNDLPVDLESGHSQLGDGGSGIFLRNRKII